MDFDTMISRARHVRSQYERVEQKRLGEAWSPNDLALGFVVDIGELAQLIQEATGKRSARSDLPDALRHEFADCLWSLIVLSDKLGIDIQSAFEDTIEVSDLFRTGKRSAQDPLVGDDVTC